MFVSVRMCKRKDVRMVSDADCVSVGRKLKGRTRRQQWTPVAQRRADLRRDAALQRSL